MRAAERVAARAAPSTRGSAESSRGAAAARPALELEGGAEGAAHAAERVGGDADRGGEDRHVAGERLDRGEAEALVVGGDEDRVGGVDPERHLVGLDRAAGEQLRVAGRGQLGGAVVALLRAGGVGGEEQVAAVGVEAELAPRLGSRQRAGSGARSGPQGRTAEPGTRGRPGRPSSGSNRARETAATRSTRQARRRESGPTSQWRTSVPWKLTTSGRAPARRAHQPTRP